MSRDSRPVSAELAHHPGYRACRCWGSGDSVSAWAAFLLWRPLSYGPLPFILLAMASGAEYRWGTTRSSKGRAFVYRSTIRPVVQPPSTIRSNFEPEAERLKFVAQVCLCMCAHRSRIPARAFKRSNSFRTASPASASPRRLTKSGSLKMEAARKGEVSAVLVWKLDRFGRSSLDVLSNIRQLTNAGVRFIAVTQGLDVHPQGDAISNLILGVLAAVSEFERSLISERTALAAKAVRRAGRPWGVSAKVVRSQVR